MIVLGIDPGVATIGFGVVRAERQKMCIRDRDKFRFGRGIQGFPASIFLSRLIG